MTRKKQVWYKQWWAILLLAIIVISLLRSFLFPPQDITAPSFQQITEPTTSYTPFQTVALSGERDKVTKFFYLREGLVKFKTRHVGDRNIIVKLLDSNGEHIELLVNDIGDYNGEKLVTIDYSGNYILNVEAGGEWTITISDPKATDEELRALLEVQESEQSMQVIIPWEEFFMDCKQQFNPTKLKNPNIAEQAQNECEKEYAKTYNLPEYCKKIEDTQILINCWMQLAINYENEDYCRELKNIVVDSEVQDCKQRARGQLL